IPQPPQPALLVCSYGIRSRLDSSRRSRERPCFWFYAKQVICYSSSSMEEYPAKQPGEPESFPDMEIAPAAPPDAVTREGVAYRLAKWQRLMQVDAFFAEVRRLADIEMGLTEQRQPTEHTDGDTLDY